MDARLPDAGASAVSVPPRSSAMSAPAPRCRSPSWCDPKGSDSAREARVTADGREWLRAVGVYARPRVIAIGFLGFASGLPLLLTLSTLSIWLAEEGVTKTAIGLFALVGIPYSLKFLWAPLIDRLPVPLLTRALGRRRGWMILTQVLLMAALLGLGATSPAEMPEVTAICALAVAFCSASQDIVIDAHRVEILEEREYGAGAAMIVFGYRCGLLVAGAGALYIASITSWF